MRFINILLLGCLTFLSLNCQHQLLKRESKSNTAVSSQEAIDTERVDNQEPPLSESEGSDSEIEEYAVILGPGSARTFAHAGVLRELNRSKLSIKWIVGLENASLPAFLYAENPDPFQVEWAFFKWKDLDFINKEQLDKSIKSQFKLSKLDQLKIETACPSYSSVQGKTYLYQKGDILSALEMCFYSFEANPKALAHAHPAYLRPLILQALKQGLKIIYIDVLSDIRSFSINSEKNYIWGLWKESLAQQLAVFPEVIIIQPKLTGSIEKKELRTEWMKKGAEAVSGALKNNLIK